MVIWLIGLSGSGKTTLASEIVKYEKNIHKQKQTILIDGDIVRDIFGNDLGYSLEDRLVNAKRICGLVKFLDDQGLNVVCAILSIFPEISKWNRQNFTNYYEVFIDAPIDVITKRDSKGIYGKYKRGELKDVVGMDIKFPIPRSPDLVIQNNKSKEFLLSYAKQICKLIGN
jgi:cytidine diphosphoramidate kinase